YDMASILPYPQIDVRRAKLAMKIGGMYPLRTIGARQWEKLAVECRLNPQETLERVIAFAQSMPDHVSDLQKEMVKANLRHSMTHRLADALIARAHHCLKLLKLRPTT